MGERENRRVRGRHARGEGAFVSFSRVFFLFSLLLSAFQVGWAESFVFPSKYRAQKKLM